MSHKNQSVSINVVGNRSLLQSVELLFEFVKTDLKLKYPSLTLGIVWVVFQPLIMAYFFTHIRNYISASHTIPKVEYSQMYIILTSWFFFATALQRSIYSIRANINLIFTINFPVILLPFSVVISSFIDVFINIVFYLVFFFLFSGKIAFNIPVFFLILLISGIFIMALCLLFSSLNCFVGEIRHVAPYITNLSLLNFPILYSEDFVPDNFKVFYLAFPLVWMILRTSDVLKGNIDTFFSLQTIYVLIISILVLVLVYLFYKRLEKYIVDYL